MNALKCGVVRVWRVMMLCLASLLVVGVVVGVGVGVGGCAGDSARVNALGPAIVANWPGVRDDAALGIRARASPAAASALGVSLEGPGVAETRTNRLQLMDEAMTLFSTGPP